MERKIHKRKREMERMKREVKVLKKERTRFLEEYENKMEQSRSDFYNSVTLPYRTWPRLDALFTVVVSSISLLLEFLQEHPDLILRLVEYLSPKEFQSISLVSKLSQSLFQSTTVVYHFTEWTIKRTNASETWTLSSSVPKAEWGFYTTRSFITTLRKLFEILETGARGLIHVRHPMGRLSTVNLPPQGSQIFFYNTATFEFGEVTDEIFFSYSSFEEKLSIRAREFKEKYGFSPSWRSLMSGHDLNLLSVKPLSEFDRNTRCKLDLYLIGHKNSSSYYHRLTHSNNDIKLFYFDPAYGDIDIYHDWFLMRYIYSLFRGQFSVY